MLGPGMITFGFPYAVLFAGATTLATPSALRFWCLSSLAIAGAVVGIGTLM